MAASLLLKKREAKKAQHSAELNAWKTQNQINNEDGRAILKRKLPNSITEETVLCNCRRKKEVHNRWCTTTKGWKFQSSDDCTQVGYIGNEITHHRSWDIIKLNFVRRWCRVFFANNFTCQSISVSFWLPNEKFFSWSWKVRGIPSWAPLNFNYKTAQLLSATFKSS